MKDLNRLSQNMFTMVEENFEFWWSKILLNKRFEPLIAELFSTWLNKILDSDDIQRSRIKDLSTFMTEYLHHGWIDGLKWRILYIWDPWLEFFTEFGLRYCSILLTIYRHVTNNAGFTDILLTIKHLLDKAESIIDK